MPTRGLQLELGLFGGGHFFADNLELGVADDPGNVPHPKNGFIFGVRAAATILPWISFEGEVGGIPSADSFHDYSIFLISYKLHALVHLLDGPFRPFVLAGVGWMQVASVQPNPGYTEIAKDTDFDFHVGVGAKLALVEGLDARLDARAVFLPNTNKNRDSLDPEVLLGLSYRFGGEREVVALPPPPPPPPPPPAPTPAPTLRKDSDGDDIPDDVDKCPHEAEDKDGFQDDDGCPDLDNDADGIPDAKDKCPNDAEDKDGFQDDDGCPDLDNDGDGIPDAKDKCPNEPETKNGFQDDDGCPDELPAAVKKFTGAIKGITFPVNSSQIQKSSFKVLGDAVKVLKDYPDLKLEVSGHTSSDGKAESNQKLSQDRAESVKAYLVSAGVGGERIVAVGYGSDRSVADNKTKQGRELNRRIEFRLLTSDDTAPAAPAGGPPAPPAEPIPTK